jgi:hypothetical protein
MFKVTCLTASQRETGTPRKLGLGSPQRMASAQRYLMWSKHPINQYATTMFYEHKKWKSEWFWEIWRKNHQSQSRGCKDMAKISYRVLFEISGKWLGLYLEIFLDFGVRSRNLWTVAWFWVKARASLQRWLELLVLNYLPIGNLLNSIQQLIDRWRHWLTMNRGQREVSVAHQSSCSRPILATGGPMWDGENEEGIMGIRFCLLPRLGRRRGGGTLAEELHLEMAMAWVQ